MRVVIFPRGKKVDGDTIKHYCFNKAFTITRCGLKIGKETHTEDFEFQEGSEVYIEAVRRYVTCKNCLKGD